MAATLLGSIEQGAERMGARHTAQAPARLSGGGPPRACPHYLNMLPCWQATLRPEIRLLNRLLGAEGPEQRAEVGPAWGLCAHGEPAAFGRPQRLPSFLQFQPSLASCC